MSQSSSDSIDLLEESKQSLLGFLQSHQHNSKWKHQPERRFHLTVILPWLLSLALSILLALSMRRTKQIGCNEVCFWKQYEIEGARREISPIIKEVKFTGGLKIKPDVGLYRDIDPELPVYVGKPSPEVDAAWSKLIDPLNIFVTLDEAAAMGEEGMGIEPVSGLYMAMPQGIHDLHCLNMIRKALNLEHYQEMNISTLGLHLDHCLDGLRQSLMCYGDMTIINEYWTEHKGDRGGMMADFDNVHVCRDFDSLRNWMSGRNAEDDEVWPEVAERLWAGQPHT